MVYQHRPLRYIFGLLSLSVALAGCQPPDTTPTSTPIAAVATRVIPTTAPSSTPVATPTVVPTAVPPSPTQAQITPSPTMFIGEDPTLPPPSPPPFVRTADRLPINQPWLLVDDGTHLCGELAFDQSLIAIDHTGGWTRLNRRVTAFAKRTGLPPLLATCTAKGAVAILNPVHWTSVRVSVPPGFFITRFVVSSDQKQAIFCHSVYKCLYSTLINKTIVLAPFTESLPSGDGPFTGVVGWGRTGLYYALSYSEPRSTTLLFVGDPAHPDKSLFLERDAPFTLDDAHDQFLRILYTPLSPLSFSYDLIRSDGMTLSDLSKGTTQAIEQPAWITYPAFAPDGMALVYVRTLLKNGSDVTPPPPHRELVLIDSIQNTKTILTDTLILPYAHTPLWSQDGQRIIIGTLSPEGGRQVTIMRRDGTQLNTVPLPDHKFLVWGVTHDDQTLLYWNNGYGVSWLPLRAGDAPYAPDVLADGHISAVILPPMQSDTPVPSAPTQIAPLPVTQLPTPAIGIPTPEIR